MAGWMIIYNTEKISLSPISSLVLHCIGSCGGEIKKQMVML